MACVCVRIMMDVPLNMGLRERECANIVNFNLKAKFCTHVPHMLCMLTLSENGMQAEYAITSLSANHAWAVLLITNDIHGATIYVPKQFVVNHSSRNTNRINSPQC